MTPQPSPKRKLSTSQITVAAESLVAAQFALSGFDILEQASRSRFFFDLAVARSGGMMKISVYASFNGFWDLVDRYMDPSKHAHATAADYHRAINRWFENHSSRVACCLVQFEPADLHRMPRIYLASAGEVATMLHGKIDQLSTEELGPLGMDVVHRLEGLPASWRFSQARIAQLMEMPLEEVAVSSQIALATPLKESVQAQPIVSEHSLAMVN